MKVLIVEDSKELAKAIATTLENANYEPTVTNEGAAGLNLALNESYDILLLDINLPVMSGFEIAEKIREAGNRTPIIMITARDAIKDKLKGFEIGVDDYITKPFDMRELMARMQLHLNKGGGGRKQNPILEYAGLTLDRDRMEAKKGKKDVELTKIEMRLLEYMMENPEIVLTNDDIIKEVWGEEPDLITPPIRTHIKNLRRKIGDDNYEIIKTVPGIGYKLCAP